MSISTCCGAPAGAFLDIGLCPDCHEHCDWEEEEPTDCCESKANGFRCTCYKSNPLHSRQAEDDGYADWAMERERDKQLTEGDES